MSITDKSYNKLSDIVYWLDPNDKKKYSPDLKEGTIIIDVNNKLKILKIQENSKTNGMQAMAVVPVNKAGKVDMSKVVITYAGTNLDDNKDIQTKILIKKHLLKNTKFFFARYCHYNMLGVEST
ncbi:hypothetical protein ACFFIF_10790 [Vagococcus entomophilus]|uniref:Uncharacterized protein n=1 Tax=Vagococcus entomophilus TaxID=1160095 RepID=A0A430AF02_9ENTE|nr:hypothetical protein [Vagococcus entomophilus]RSU06176.1 hypothetical protein CBF30_10695 [Vagococcus entomophilus]